MGIVHLLPIDLVLVQNDQFEIIVEELSPFIKNRLLISNRMNSRMLLLLHANAILGSFD